MLSSTSLQWALAKVTPTEEKIPGIVSPGGGGRKSPPLPDTLDLWPFTVSLTRARRGGAAGVTRLHRGGRLARCYISSAILLFVCLFVCWFVFICYFSFSPFRSLSKPFSFTLSRSLSFIVIFSLYLALFFVSSVLSFPLFLSIILFSSRIQGIKRGEMKRDRERDKREKER